MASPSSIIVRATVIDPSTLLSRAASSSSHTTSSTTLASASDSELDAEMPSTSSHARGHTTYDASNPSLSKMAARRMASPFVSPFTAPPVTLLVGGLSSPSKEIKPVPFYVHEDVLTRMSAFFRAAFQLGSHASFSEGVSRTMKLPEDRPEDFAYLLQWVYWQLSNAPLSIQPSEQFPAVISLQASDSSALSLWHISIDIPLSHFHAYRALKKAEKVISAAVKEHPEAQPYLSTVDANDWHFGLAQQPPIQQGQILALTQQTFATEAPKETSPVPADTASPSSPWQKQKLVRPPPPVFAPLIRLYILADKYSLPTSLKRDICNRVQQVGTEGKCVPDAENIVMLWDGVLETASQQEGTNLKDTVLGMYAALSTKSFGGLFYCSSTNASSSHLVGLEDGRGQAQAHVTTDVKVRDGGEEAYQWDPVFMRDLLARKFEGRGHVGTNTAVTLGSEGGGGRGGMGNDGGEWVSFGELGRVRRRRERFPSLYGVRNRSGEEVLGGSP